MTPKNIVLFSVKGVPDWIVQIDVSNEVPQESYMSIEEMDDFITQRVLNIRRHASELSSRKTKLSGLFYFSHE